MTGSLIAGVLVAIQIAAGGSGQRPRQVTAGDFEQIARLMEPPVLLTAPLTDAAGSLRGPAVELSKSSATMYVTSAAGSCESAITTDMPQHVRDGWKVTARVLDASLRSATVAIQWQRVWAGGQVISNGAGGTSEIVLGSRDRIPLDHLVMAAPGLECHGQTRRLELYMWSNVINGAPDRPAMVPPAPVTMEVWLVHHTPAGVETTYALSMPFDHTSSRFVFRTRPITSVGASYYLDLDAQVRAVQREDGSLGLWTAIRRALIDASTGTMRLGWGTGGSMTEWAQPGDVISFDLPPASAGGRGGGGGGSGRGTAAGGVASGAAPSHEFPLLGHRFSLRLRLTPTR
jgi:hypothetical protein